MRVGIFGGTFNPPHSGHESAAKTAAAQLSLDILLVVPSGIPPHKRLPQGSPSADIRLAMTQNAFSEIPGSIVSDIEVRISGPAYTIETVNAIKKMYPDAELFLLMGTDMFLSLELWKDHLSLLKNITPVVFSRSDDDLKKITEYASHLTEKYGSHVEIIKNTVVPVSSSELRDILPLRGGMRYINDTNYSYIIRSRLYNARPDWDWLRTKAHEMLNPKRVPHVIACEKMALELAERWNVNEDDAREAAILHDITKRLDIDEHQSVLKEYSGVSISKPTKSESKLLHAMTGAILAKALFGVSDEVEDAIRWHTTGKAKMSTLSKVLYLADYVEETRDFPGVEDLRRLAFENIDEAMIMGLEMTISDITARGIAPDEATLAAIGDLKG